MALPQLAGAGVSAPMLKDAFSQQDQHGDLLATLVDLTKDLVDNQAKLFQKLLLVMDTKKEDTKLDSASGSVEGVEEEMTLGVKDLFLGAFAAITLWANDLAKYIRAAFLPAQLLKPVMTAFKTAFSSAALVKAFAPVKDFFGRINKALAPKNFTSLTKAIKFFTVPLQNLIKGFTAVGKEVTSFGKMVTTSFKELSVAGKIGASIRAIVDPFVKFFSMFSSMSGLSSIGKTIGPLVEKVSKFLPTMKGILSKVLLPLFAIFDFVSGFIEGFSSEEGVEETRSTMEKVMDGLFAGAIKLIKGIFIVPLDLLKDGVSWLAEKMGFENFSAALDSFSFNDTFDKFIKFGKNIFSSEPEDGYFSIVKMVGDGIDDLVKSIKDLIPDDIAGSLKELAGDALDIITTPQRWIWNNAIKPAIDAIIKMFGGSAELPDTGEIGDMASNFLKNILKTVLPNPEAGVAQYLASKAIPDSVYEYAGLDPKTGEEIPKPQGVGKEETTLPASLTPNSGLQPEGAQLSDATKEVAVKKEQNQGQAAPVVIQAGNGDTNNYGGGTTILGPSEKSNYADNWAYS